MKNRTDIFEKYPIPKAVWSLALPTILGMLVTVIYNLADTFFVGQLNDVNQIAAVSITMPIFMLLMAIGTIFGIGSGTYISRMLGAKENLKVKNASSFSFYAAIFLGILCIIFGIIFMPQILSVSGASPATYEYAKDYLKYIIMSSPIIILGFSLGQIARAEGAAKEAMIGMMIGTVVNIILDPILIFGLFGMPKLGVAGAAIATVIGQTIAALMALTFNIKKNHDIHLHFKGFRPSSRTIGKILSVGIPSILMASMGSVMTFGMNKILMTFSATAIAVFGSYFKLQSFIFMPVFGLNNGMVPIIAFSYGARKRDRMVKTIKLSIAYAVCIMIIGFAIMQIFPDKLLLMFNASETMLSIGVPALRIISVSFLFAGISIVSLSVFQALGHGVLSMMVSFMRQLIFLLPSAYLLSLTGDINKVWFSFLIAEVISVSLSLLSMRYLYKKVIKNL